MSKKILTVDDDPAILRLLDKYLVDAGYEVLQATNGQEALRIILDQAPPIIITDWTMPEMDGVELCRTLRNHEGVRFAYVVILTAHTELDRVAEAFEAGADDFLTKPIRRPELTARLRAGEHIARLESDLCTRTREIYRLNAEMAIANDRLAAVNDKLKLMATTDELTDLLNRREALSKLAEMWNTKARYANPFSCVVLDIDHFKKVNDTYGHAVGDAVLRECAEVFRSTVRATDFPCRIGGEEFVIICPNSSALGAAICAEHIRAAIEGHDFTHKDLHLRVTISCGVAECVDESVSGEEVIRRADEALYLSKQNGRNRVTVFQEPAVLARN